MPSATAREFQRAALALGFVRRRQTGSHERWTHSDGRSVTIPLHGGREIGPPLFFKILRQLNVSLEEFDRLRRVLSFETRATADPAFRSRHDLGILRRRVMSARALIERPVFGRIATTRRAQHRSRSASTFERDASSS